MIEALYCICGATQKFHRPPPTEDSSIPTFCNRASGYQGSSLISLAECLYWPVQGFQCFTTYPSTKPWTTLHFSTTLLGLQSAILLRIHNPCIPLRVRFPHTSRKAPVPTAKISGQAILEWLDGSSLAIEYYGIREPRACEVERRCPEWSHDPGGPMHSRFHNDPKGTLNRLQGNPSQHLMANRSLQICTDRQRKPWDARHVHNVTASVISTIPPDLSSLVPASAWTTLKARQTPGRPVKRDLAAWFKVSDDKNSPGPLKIQPPEVKEDTGCNRSWNHTGRPRS
ncbi:hypothetical protein CISG_02735 [Coccidioides immitis RMSCC 3703]|uniref:Uncharacterized protein n=1 Tax=Coccidioides immitis RMSCC 3703 TaxID=454286 RepID=A0A0J8U4C7_COCIT|nr:hypothetical protein CISG_02735 [Coccidioides immitis RMSCC 3703]